MPSALFFFLKTALAVLRMTIFSVRSGFTVSFCVYSINFWFVVTMRFLSSTLCVFYICVCVINLLIY